MDTYTFKTNLLLLLKEPNNPFVECVDLYGQEDFILVTCKDSTTYGLQIHKSQYYEFEKSHKNEIKDYKTDELITKMTYVQDNGPVFFTILITLFELHDMNIISETALNILLDRVGECLPMLRNE